MLQVFNRLLHGPVLHREAASLRLSRVNLGLEFLHMSPLSISKGSLAGQGLVRSIARKVSAAYEALFCSFRRTVLVRPERTRCGATAWSVCTTYEQWKEGLIDRSLFSRGEDVAAPEKDVWPRMSMSELVVPPAAPIPPVGRKLSHGSNKVYIV